MFVGSLDKLSTVEDNQWTHSQLKTVVHYKEYALGHMSFQVAKDMSFFTVDGMNLLRQYHPVNGQENQKPSEDDYDQSEDKDE